jgi:predicted CXXCH cytochrome family protein
VSGERSLRRARRPHFALLVAVAALTPALVAACRAPLAAGHRREEPTVRSNVARADYVGSERCARCHADIAKRFFASPMHRMTRTAASTDVRAPFDGRSFAYKDDRLTLSTDGAERFMRVESAQFGAHAYRVTRVIGGHHREDFAGVEVARPVAGAKPIGDPRDESILPVSWVYALNDYRYKGYSVMSPERPGLRAGPIWNRTCIFCHNTVPYVSTVFGALAEAAGGRPFGYQGEWVDQHLPRAQRWSFSIDDAGGLASIARDEARWLGDHRGDAHAAIDPGMKLPAALEAIVGITRRDFDGGAFVEQGIGCESCHGGGREHAEDPAVALAFGPRSPTFSVKHADLSPRAERAQSVTRTCARCHQVLFAGYPWSWENQPRASLRGGSHISSGEGRDFLLGGCASAMTCTDCHDPHAADSSARLAAFGGEGPRGDEGDRVCLRCHATLAPSAARAAHTHHRAGSSGDRCVGCHMPRKNLDLDGGLGRYHRIGSPNDPARVVGDRPLECALCHRDKTVRALADQLERWWHRPIDRAALAALYGGSLDVEPLVATLTLGKPHEQAVALATLGAGGDPPRLSLLPTFGALLVHPIGLVRGYARRAIERTLGKPLPIDLHQEDAAITAALARFAADEPRWPAGERPRAAAPADASPPTR